MKARNTLRPMVKLIENVATKTEIGQLNTDLFEIKVCIIQLRNEPRPTKVLPEGSGNMKL